jgi:hypothetical protein
MDDGRVRAGDDRPWAHGRLRRSVGAHAGRGSRTAMMVWTIGDGTMETARKRSVGTAWQWNTATTTMVRWRRSVQAGAGAPAWCADQGRWRLRGTWGRRDSRARRRCGRGARDDDDGEAAAAEI